MATHDAATIDRALEIFARSSAISRPSTDRCPPARGLSRVPPRASARASATCPFLHKSPPQKKPASSARTASVDVDRRTGPGVASRCALHDRSGHAPKRVRFGGGDPPGQPRPAQIDPGAVIEGATTRPISSKHVAAAPSRGNGEMQKMNATATVAPAGPQYMRALERANQVRLARAELKRRVAVSELGCAEVIIDCPWEAESMAWRPADESAALGTDPLPQVPLADTDVGEEDDRLDDRPPAAHAGGDANSSQRGRAGARPPL